MTKDSTAQLPRVCNPELSRVSSGFTIGSGSSVMTAGWQVFSFPRVPLAHVEGLQNGLHSIS